MTNDYETDKMIDDIIRLEQDIESDEMEFDYLDEVEEMIPYE